MSSPSHTNVSAGKPAADRVRWIIADQLGLDLGRVVDTAQLDNDLGCDSLDAVELVMAIEEDLEIEIPDSASADLEHWTVGMVIVYVERLVAAKAVA